MRKLAVDVNVVLTWLGLQNAGQQEAAIRIFSERVRGKLEVVAPDFLLVELLNVLKWRLKRSEDDSREMAKRVMGAGIKLVPMKQEEILRLDGLMYKWGLTAYDAWYLLMAQTEKCKLVTSDPKLLEVKRWCVGVEQVW